MKKQEISAMAATLVAAVRQYSRDQKKTWNQIPSLYNHGKHWDRDVVFTRWLWQIDSSIRNNHHTVYVDLRTGELVSPDDPKLLAQDKFVLELASAIEELDAKAIVKQLKKKLI